MNTQKKHKQKVARQREVQKKLLRKRLKKRAEDREEQAKVLQERENQRVVNRHTATICYDKEGRLTETEIRKRLDNNMEILRALQEEYEAEQKMRAENLAKLPELQQQVQVEPIRNWGGEAEVVFTPNPEPATTAEAPSPTDEKKDA